MKIAVVGSGISGLASALILSQKYHVTLFEADSRLGGHAHTFISKDENGKHVAVDTGFLVYNKLTYPHFCGMLDFLDVETCESNMSLSVQIENGVQWAGTNFRTLFAQKSNFFKIDFLLMLRDILKFHNHAEENCELARSKKWTIAELIRFRKYSKSFVDWYLIPMTGAIWSMSSKDVLEFPAETFMQFCINHRLLQVENRPTWRTVKNGSVNYVNKIADRLKDVRLNHKIDRISQSENKLIIHSAKKTEIFDKIVLATSAPIAHQLLKTDFPLIAKNLEAAKTSGNHITLHQDISPMPKNKNIWSSWNVKANQSQKNDRPIELTYYLNKLQPLSGLGSYFISLNSDKRFNNELYQTTYHHPQFDSEMISTQKKLPSFQGQHGIYFAGAWTRYGFHEDGILSAVNVAEHLEVKPPWQT